MIRPFVHGLIEMVRHKKPEELKAAMLSEVLSTVTPVSPVAVPGDSILRETIGSSQLDY